MINALTRLIHSNGSTQTEVKLEGDLGLLSRELAVICSSIHNLSKKQGKEAEFLEAFEKQYQEIQKAKVIEGR